MAIIYCYLYNKITQPNDYITFFTTNNLVYKNVHMLI